MTAIDHPPFRLGIDLGGTKTAGIVLGPSGAVKASLTVLSAQGGYEATLHMLRDLIGQLEASAGQRCSIGIGMPGSISPRTGLVQNANSTWLNGQPLDSDLQRLTGRPIRFANDANCFALSEATDGAGDPATLPPRRPDARHTVFGVIIGTGCGGGVVVDGKIVDGSRGIGGEWGHNPLPWPAPEELAIEPCWCGRRGCMETWVSGPALSADHARHTGQNLTAAAVSAACEAGDAAAHESLTRHAKRLARGLATIVNLFDPDVIVLGGGLSSLPHLYCDLPRLMAPYIFCDTPSIEVRPPKWGPASGVRGAAWLW